MDDGMIGKTRYKILYSICRLKRDVCFFGLPIAKPAFLNRVSRVFITEGMIFSLRKTSAVIWETLVLFPCVPYDFLDNLEQVI